MDMVGRIGFTGGPLPNHLGILEGLTLKFLLVSGIRYLGALNANNPIGLPDWPLTPNFHISSGIKVPETFNPNIS